MKTSSLSDWKMQLALGAAIISLLIVSTISFRGAAMSDESEAVISHTHEVLENIQALLLATDEVESSVRGYGLTGQSFYLDSYRSSKLCLAQS